MRVGTAIASGVRHVVGASLQAALVAAIVVALAFAAALVVGSSPSGADSVLAAKGGNGNGPSSAGEGSITVPDGVFGGTTTATANPGGDGAWVRFRCYQNGGVAEEAYVRVDSNNQATVQLGPTPSWTGGAAECTADEGSWSNGRWRVIASTTFAVSG